MENEKVYQEKLQNCFEFFKMKGIESKEYKKLKETLEIKRNQRKTNQFT
jgi:hypothetical protein